MPKSVFSQKYRRFRFLLAQARKQAGLTQIQLSKRLHRPQSYVSKYETGERRVDVVEFLDIAKAMGISAGDILEQLEDPTNEE